MNFLNRLRHDEGGLATVEASIALFWLFLVLFGIMEGGLFLLTKHQMDRASREAARYCALYTPSLTLDQNKTRCTTNVATVISQWLPGTTQSVTFPTFAGAQGVTISISKSLESFTSFFSWPLTLSSSATVVADWSGI